MVHPLRDRAAIVGVGYTEFSKNSGVSTLALALRAISAACADAGIAVHDLDGVACHRVGDSVQAAVVLQSLGLRDPHFFVDQFGGGSASHTVSAKRRWRSAGVPTTCVCVPQRRSEWRMGGTGRRTMWWSHTDALRYATAATVRREGAQYRTNGATREDFGASHNPARQSLAQTARHDARAIPWTIPRVSRNRRAVCLFELSETDAPSRGRDVGRARPRLRTSGVHLRARLGRRPDTVLQSPDDFTTRRRRSVGRL